MVGLGMQPLLLVLSVCSLLESITRHSMLLLLILKMKCENPKEADPEMRRYLFFSTRERERAGTGRLWVAVRHA